MESHYRDLVVEFRFILYMCGNSREISRLLLHYITDHTRDEEGAVLVRNALLNV
jgi:hypothetical protein